MKIPIEMMKEIRESGYDKKLVYNYIRELLDSEKRKFPKGYGSRAYRQLLIR